MTYKETEIGEIPNEWSLISLKDLLNKNGYIRGPFGSALRRHELKESGTPVYEQEHAIYNSRKFRYFIDNEKFHQLSRFVVKENDLIVSCSGTLGRVSIICNNDPKGIISQALLILRPDIQKINPLYLKYFFTSPVGFNSLVNRSTGSVQVNLAKREIIQEIKLAVPPLAEQRAIAKVLSDIDAKIELNLQMNKTLEEMAQAIFKHWFVDFEFPNENGKPYKSSGGRMAYNEELGKEIPEGWDVKKLDALGSFKNGINYTRDESGDTEFSIVNVRDIANNKLLLKESLDIISIDAAKATDYLLDPNDILIARSASPGEVSLVLGDLEQIIYSGFSIRYRPISSTNYLFLFLSLQHLKSVLLSFSVGTTLQSVNQETLKNSKVVCPPDDLLSKFNLLSEELYYGIQNGLVQNNQLSILRDSLLPKLMSGKIRVPVEVKNNA